MNTATLFFGFLFLINPDFVTLDFLPDFIGYALIAHGLYRLSFLEDRLASARKYTWMLALCGVLKLFSNLIVFSSSLQNTRLTVSFFFFVAELWLGILLVSCATGGVQYLASRKNGDVALSSLDTVRLYLYVFVIVKNLSAFLPQAVVIFFTDVDADPDVVENFAQTRAAYSTTRNTVFVLCAIAVLAIGIMTARVLLSYLKKCRADTAFCTALREDFDVRVTNNPALLCRLSVKRAMLCFFLSFLFLGDLYLDHINLFLRPLCGILSIMGLNALKGRVFLPRALRLTPAFSVVMSLVAALVRLLWLNRDGFFVETFPASPLSLLFAVLGQGSVALCVFTVLVATKRCAETVAGVTFKKDFILLSLLSLGVLIAGAIQYRYVGRSAVVPAVEWVLYLLTVFFAQNAFERVKRETEWKWM